VAGFQTTPKIYPADAYPFKHITLSEIPHHLSFLINFAPYEILKSNHQTTNSNQRPNNPIPNQQCLPRVLPELQALRTILPTLSTAVAQTVKYAQMTLILQMTSIDLFCRATATIIELNLAVMPTTTATPVRPLLIAMS
jgi:hypothetical protein